MIAPQFTPERVKTRPDWLADAGWGMSRVVAVLALPYLWGSFMILRSEDLPSWFIVVPTAVLVPAVLTGSLAGVVRSRDARRLAARTGMAFARTLLPAVAQGARLYPFDELRRASAEGVQGWHQGRRYERFVHGARALVHVTALDRPLPPLQILPRVPGSTFDAGGGQVTALGVEWFDSRWRVVAPSAQYAHAVLIPPVLEALEGWEGRRPIITIDGLWIWTSDAVQRMNVERSLDRFALLASVADRIPAFVAGPDAGGTLLESSHFFRGYRTRNSRGRIALMLSASVVLAPVGLVVAFFARRALRRGEADNRTTVAWASWLSVVGTVASVVFVVGALAGWL